MISLFGVSRDVEAIGSLFRFPTQHSGASPLLMSNSLRRLSRVRGFGEALPLLAATEKFTTNGRKLTIYFFAYCITKSLPICSCTSLGLGVWINIRRVNYFGQLEPTMSGSQGLLYPSTLWHKGSFFGSFLRPILLENLLGNWFQRLNKTQPILPST